LNAQYVQPQAASLYSRKQLRARESADLDRRPIITLGRIGSHRERLQELAGVMVQQLGKRFIGKQIGLVQPMMCALNRSPEVGALRF
jgi:hypothetical protein